MTAAGICRHLADLALAALGLARTQATLLNCPQSHASIPTSFLLFFNLVFAQLNGVDQRPVPASDASFAVTILSSPSIAWEGLNIQPNEFEVAALRALPERRSGCLTAPADRTEKPTASRPWHRRTKKRLL